MPREALRMLEEGFMTFFRILENLEFLENHISV